MNESLDPKLVAAMWVETLDRAERLEEEVATLRRRLSGGLKAEVENEDGTVHTFASDGFELRFVDGQVVMTGRISRGCLAGMECPPAVWPAPSPTSHV
jgi:hypothetical protein